MATDQKIDFEANTHQHDELTIEAEQNELDDMAEEESATEEAPRMAEEHHASNGASADPASQIEELKRKLLYAQAEFVNFRRRKEDEQREQTKYANSELIKNLLPVVDNLERALKSVEQSKNFEALLAGVSGTMRQMQACLQKAGLVEIEALGKEFDPQYHEAIGVTEESDLPSNHVAEELQRGYTLHERVIRPSLVKVTQH